MENLQVNKLLREAGATEDQIKRFTGILLSNFTVQEAAWIIINYLIQYDTISDYIVGTQNEDQLVAKLSYLLATEYNWSQDTNIFEKCDYNPEELQLLLTMYNKLVTNYPHLPLIDHFHKVPTINPN